MPKLHQSQKVTTKVTTKRGIANEGELDVDWRHDSKGRRFDPGHFCRRDGLSCAPPGTPHRTRSARRRMGLA